MNKIYYVYEHIRKDTNTVFYVGIGTNITNNSNQNHYKRSKSNYRRSKMWKNIVNKVGYIIKIVFETSILEEVFKKEVELIEKYGRKIKKTGNLVNISDGGNGNFGFKPSKQQIERVRECNRGRKATVETRQKMSIGQKNKFVPKEVGEKISNSKKGKNIGIKIPSKSKRIRHIPTGEVFRSISKVAKKFNYRRNTFGRFINSNELSDFEFINEDMYFKLSGKRNWRKNDN